MVEGNAPGLALAERVAPYAMALRMSRRRARRRSTPTACGVEKRLWVWEASLHHTGETMRRKLRIGIIDLVSKGPTHALYARVMHANLASIMPQVIAVWCEQEGHDVLLECYTGFEDLESILPRDIDVLFIGAFTQAAQLSYAISAMFRARGVVTVLGGPH